MHREGEEKGYKIIFMFAFGRFHQNQTHPSPKGNAKALFIWHVFLIQGWKGLKSPFPLPPQQCGRGGADVPGTGAVTSPSSCPSSARKQSLGEIWHKNLHRRVCRTPGQHCEHRAQEENVDANSLVRGRNRELSQASSWGSCEKTLRKN